MAAEKGNLKHDVGPSREGIRPTHARWCRRLGIALAALASLLIWWLIAAGPTAVWRTLVYNVSGIDDALIFPQRRLAAAPRPWSLAPAAARERWASTHAGPHGLALDRFLSDSGTVALLVIQDGSIVHEHYAPGFGPTTPTLSFSVAKSIFAILVACALDDGYFKSLDQPVTDFVPELRPRGFDAVTLGHLMRMTSGIAYAENDWPFGIHARFYYTDRLQQEILALRLKNVPGSEFRYKSADAFLLALALQRALGGRTITDYMQERLWTPLGMETDGSWSVDHEPGGLEKVGCCLAATARDFARFGQLLVDGGTWNGRRIVAADWVERLRRSETYDSLWWRIGPRRTDFIATGHLGQFLYVNPENKVVIVRLGSGTGGLDVQAWKDWFVALADSPAETVR